MVPDMPSVSDVQRISALDDAVVRNLQITQCYHELAVSLAQHLPYGANWCTMATWASRQAGQSIREQDLRRTLERLLRESSEVESTTAALEAQTATIRGDSTESLAGAATALRDALSPAAAFDRVEPGRGSGEPQGVCRNWPRVCPLSGALRRWAPGPRNDSGLS